MAHRIQFWILWKFLLPGAHGSHMRIPLTNSKYVPILIEKSQCMLWLRVSVTYRNRQFLWILSIKCKRNVLLLDREIQLMKCSHWPISVECGVYNISKCFEIYFGFLFSFEISYILCHITFVKILIFKFNCIFYLFLFFHFITYVLQLWIFYQAFTLVEEL